MWAGNGTLMDFSDMFQQETFSDALLIIKAPTQRKRGRDEASEQQGPAEQEQGL